MLFAWTKFAITISVGILFMYGINTFHMYYMNPVYKLIAPILFIDYRILGKYWGYFCMDSIGGYFSPVRGGSGYLQLADHWSSQRAKQGKAKPIIWAKQNRQRGSTRGGPVQDDGLTPWEQHQNLYNMRERVSKKGRDGQGNNNHISKGKDRKFFEENYWRNSFVSRSIPMSHSDSILKKKN